MGTPRDSDLPGLLEAWGVGYDKQMILGDAELALSVNINPTQPPVRHTAIPPTSSGRTRAWRAGRI